MAIVERDEFRVITVRRSAAITRRELKRVGKNSLAPAVTWSLGR